MHLNMFTESFIDMLILEQQHVYLICKNVPDDVLVFLLLFTTV